MVNNKQTNIIGSIVSTKRESIKSYEWVEQATIADLLIDIFKKFNPEINRLTGYGNAKSNTNGKEDMIWYIVI